MSKLKDAMLKIIKIVTMILVLWIFNNKLNTHLDHWFVQGVSYLYVYKKNELPWL